jgi:tetratricopeptide (TPR) repeat protein
MMLRMSRLMNVSLLLVCAVLRTEAQQVEVNEQKLRDVLKLPTVQIALAVSFSNPNEFDLFGDPNGYANKIAALQKQRNGSATDAMLLFQIGEVHEKAEQKKEANQAYAQAAAMLRKQIAADAGSPPLARAKSRALLGRVLREWSGGDDAEAEKLLREAVKLAPDDWSVWRDLGRFLPSQTDRYAFTKEQRDAMWATPGTYSSEERVKMMPVPSADGFAKAESLFKEAQKCSDRAVALAPSLSEPYAVRYATRASIAFNRSFLIAARDKSKPYSFDDAIMKAMAQMEQREDLRQASRQGVTALEIGLPAVMEAMFAGIAAGGESAESSAFNPVTAKAQWQKYSPETRQTLEQAMEKLGRIAVSDPAQKPLALVLQGLLQLSAGKTSEATASLRSALQERPAAFTLREILIGMAIDAKDFAQVEDILRDIPEKLLTARYRIMLAKALQHTGDLKGQQEQTDAALKQDPNNPLAILSAAAVALKSGGEANGARALELIERAKKQLDEDDELLWDCQRLRAVYDLLHGEKLRGYAMLRVMAKQDEDDPQYKELLAAVTAP